MQEIVLSSLIEFQSVTKTYFQKNHRVDALRGIHLAIQHGEFLGIVGVSGSGKSTLMNIMGLLDQPTSGAYFFESQLISGLSEEALSRLRNKKIGFVFQSFFLLPKLSALENVMLPLFYANMPHDEADYRAHYFLKKMGVGNLSHHKPSELSGGQQQRVAIARALVNEPEIILADEPTGALDSKTGQEVMRLFKQLNAEGRTLVVITHDPHVAKQCERVVTIQDGLIQL